MAKIEITKTELIWPGKYNEDGSRKEVPRVKLPFQVIETINESRATREAKKSAQPTLFDVWEGKEGDTFEEGWKNKLIWGDNLLVMCSLLEKFAGKIDLIYIDPPFATGADFLFTAEIGEQEIEAAKEQSIIEEKVYRDTWGQGLVSYLAMMCDRLVLIRDLLAETGCAYIHVDNRMVHPLKFVMDEVFGNESFLNHVIWSYRRWPSVASNYQTMHDDILFYVKNPKSKRVFNIDYEPPSESYIKRFKGKTQVLDPDTKTRKLVVEEPTKGLPIRDVWDISIVAGFKSERTGFPTQKPEALLERVVKTSSNDGDLVADFFCGSGTSLAVAERLGRRWIGCDLSRWAIHVTRKRLLEIERCKPFEVLNLGKYERKYWQGITFSGKE